MKARLQNLGLTLATFLIACAVMEWGLRTFGSDALRLGDPYVHYQFDPVLGWSGLRNHHGYFVRTEFAHAVETNSLGMRDREITEKHNDEFRVAVLGDSFTWGMGASYGERFTEVVEKLDPHINALNFGVAGFAPIQYLLQIDQVLALKPDYVIIAFCLGNDVMDNVLENPYDRPKPYAKLSEDGASFEIVGLPVPEPREFWLYAHSRLTKLVGRGLVHLTQNFLPKQTVEPESMVFIDNWLRAPTETLTAQQRQKVASAYKVNELLIDALRQRVESVIGPHRLAVLLVPSKSEYGMSQHLDQSADRNVVADRVSAGMASLGIPTIDGRPAIDATDFWKYDAIGVRVVMPRSANCLPIISVTLQGKPAPSRPRDGQG